MLDTVKDQDSLESSEKEELIKKEEIINTPFHVITTEGKSFGALGQYRLTENMGSPEEVEEELNKLTWNRIVQVVLLLNKLLKTEDI